MPPGSRTARRAGSGPHGSGRSRIARSYRSPVPATSARPPGRSVRVAGNGPEEGLDVRHGRLQMLLAQLVGHHPSLRADGPAQRDREGARARAGLEHARSREHVGVGHDRPDVLRVDHLRAPRHLQHVVGEPGPVGDEHHALGRLQAGALARADQVVVLDGAAVRVEGRAGLERGTGRCGRADRRAAPAPPPRTPSPAQASARGRAAGSSGDLDRQAAARPARPRRCGSRLRPPRAPPTPSSPGARESSTVPSSSGERTARPSTETITSPSVDAARRRRARRRAYPRRRPRCRPGGPAGTAGPT